MTLLPSEDEHVGALRNDLADLAARLERVETAAPARLDHDLHEALARITARCKTIIEVSDLVYDEVCGRLDRLEAELAGVRARLASAPTPAPAPTWAGRSTQRYGDMVARVQGLILQLTAPGATVAVAGKGDPALLEIAGRTGWHFPRQPDGTYLGYYPRDDAAAVSLLEETRLAGADYLVFPATSLWWVEYYRGLRQHLEEHHSVVVYDPTTCAIFRLGGVRPIDADLSVVSPASRQVRELVDRLVPSGEPVALVAADVVRYGPWTRTVVLQAPVGDAQSIGQAVDRLRRDGVRYVVLPHGEPGSDSAINLWLEEAVDTVIDQRHVCAVLRITEPARTGVPGPPSPGAP